MTDEKKNLESRMWHVLYRFAEKLAVGENPPMTWEGNFRCSSKRRSKQKKITKMCQMSQQDAVKKLLWEHVPRKIKLAAAWAGIRLQLYGRLANGLR